MTTSHINRRDALKRMAAAGLAAPFAFRAYAGAAPSETVNHASFGANGMALSDIRSLTASKIPQARRRRRGGPGAAPPRSRSCSPM